MDLTGADFSGADLTGATVTDMQLATTISAARRNNLLQVDGSEVDATLHSGLSGMALVD